MVSFDYEATIKVVMSSSNPQQVRAVLGGMLQRLVCENTTVKETDLQNIIMITPTV